MDGFGYRYAAPYNSYSGYCPLNQMPNPNLRHTNWKQKGTPGSVYYPNPVTDGVDYMDNCKRAQLKAILSQVNPTLTPRLRKANTKEVGVQVNPKVDTGVQCSLGPRTLNRAPRRTYFAPRYGTVGRLTESKPQAVSYSASNQIPAVYSPVYDRRVFTVTRDYVSPFPENELCQGDQEGASLTVFQEKEDEKGSTTERVESPKEQVGEGSPAGVPEESLIPECSQTQITPKLNGPKLNSRRSPTYRFQFLEQKYGYFHCKECSTRWESAYVWCISGTNKVYFKQLCRKCMKGYNPYRVEAIQCQTCSKTQCSCPRKKRHIDLKKPHRQELCGRCKGKSLSCDNTYSFKYIV
ncbi:ZAR1-like protein [Protopterus annectens]|uniref:ZAR1-like protein n=1 Tax=Protopterus annectens TaxID=7888 RepID=UPI001CF94909|nr:ZAR1-like protein [Protopterus annectens]